MKFDDVVCDLNETKRWNNNNHFIRSMGSCKINTVLWICIYTTYAYAAMGLTGWLVGWQSDSPFTML